MYHRELYSTLCNDLYGKRIPAKSEYMYEKKKWALVIQSCSTFCDPMKCSLSGFFVHGVLQARILDWVDIHFSRGPSQSRDWTWSPDLQANSLQSEPPGKSEYMYEYNWLTLLCSGNKYNIVNKLYSNKILKKQIETNQRQTENKVGAKEKSL